MTAEPSSYCTRCGAGIAAGTHYCPHCGAGVPAAPASVATAPPPGAPEHVAADPDPLLDALRQATLGEYEIIAGVGRGGMGTVYLAHDLALDRKVAIKVLSPALVLIGGVMVDRFKREARTAASLNHPHILPIYAVKESGPLLYFVMKFVEGRTLDSIIGEVGPVPIAMVQAILVQVGDALGYAHRRGIIHRDIKCSNIMLDEEGWAVVTDFGIAKVTQAEGLTMTGVAIGTPAYMSPEQFTTKEVTGSSDQYSLGVVAYEILTGKSPFAGDSVMALMYAHVNESPRPIAELRPDCPPGLAAAVMRMLEKDAAKRWAGVDDIVGAIGASPLAHDDPVRRLMIALAKTGRHSQLLAQLRTPTSPIPSATRHPRLPARAPVPRGRRVPKVWWGVVAAAGIGAALWWLGPWRTRDAPPAPQAVAGVESVIATPAPSQGRADTVDHGSQPESIARPGPVAPPRRRRAAATEAPAAPPAQLPTPPAATQREDSLMRSLRVAALEALRRAVDAGAAASDLATGDTAFRAGESLAAQGRLSEAMVRLATAASLWAEAERLSRTRRVARDTAQPRAAEPAAQPPAARAPVDARPEIEKAIAEYGRAIESLDLAEVRRVYPWLTAEQIRGWTQFFRRVRRLTATLTVTELDVAGARAEAKVSGAYEYENASTRRTERELATFRVSLEQQPGGWRLTAIR